MSRDIVVISEHRQGEIREITFELLARGRQLAEQMGGELCAVLLGDGIDDLASALKPHAHTVVCIEDEKFRQFHSDYYQRALAAFLHEKKPYLILLGHTSYSWEIAPSLSTELKIPLVSGCSEVRCEAGEIAVKRNLYGGKIIGEVVMEECWGYMLTFAAGTFSAGEGGLGARIEKFTPRVGDEITDKKFIRFVEAVAGEVDISQAQKIVTVGRGIKEQVNIKLIEEFARSIDAVVACSRPIVDAGWMPKDRQVGSSGKTVKPKLYIALGVSGDFQHVMGMKGADTIIAVNKDPRAPIFTVADYGIVDDLFKVVPALQKKMKELKG